MKEATGWKPDGWRDDHWVGVTTTVHNARDLRGVLLNMAYAAHADVGSRVLYVLVNSRMTGMRVDKEVERFRHLVTAQIGSAVKVLTCEEPESLALVRDLPSAEFRAWLQTLVGNQLATPRKSSSRDAVFGVMFLLFLGDLRVVSARDIAVWSGASYPTVSSVLKELLVEGSIAREHGKVTLDRFPSTGWSRWVSRELDVRRQVHFVTGSAERLTIAAIVDRLNRMHRPDIAIGGAMAAAHYLPWLARLDADHLELTLHGPPHANLSFVQELDPTLSRRRNENTPARLTINFLQRPSAFFRIDDRGVIWSDPVSCMIDLHAAGQAEHAEMLMQTLLSEIGIQRLIV